MSFAGNFSISQTSEGTLTFTDTSSGTDSNLTSRRITLTKYDGNTIVPPNTTTAYIVWAIDQTSITLTDILDRDYALNIEVDWISSSPDPNGTYTKSMESVFTYFEETANYGLIQQLTANPSIINDVNFFSNFIKLRVFIDSANNAITFGSDIFSSQACLDSAKYLTDNETIFF